MTTFSIQNGETEWFASLYVTVEH